ASSHAGIRQEGSMHAQLHVWREASRHIEVTDFVDRIVDLVGRRMPADLLLVRRLNDAQSRLETVAVGRCTPAGVPDNLRTDCDAADVQMLTTWCRWGAAYHGQTSTGSRIIDVVVPRGLEGDVI